MGLSWPKHCARFVCALVAGGGVMAIHPLGTETI